MAATGGGRVHLRGTLAFVYTRWEPSHSTVLPLPSRFGGPAHSISEAVRVIEEFSLPFNLWK